MSDLAGAVEFRVVARLWLGFYAKPGNSATRPWCAIQARGTMCIASSCAA